MNKKYRALMLATTLSMCALAVVLIAFNVIQNDQLTQLTARQIQNLKDFEKSVNESPEPPTRENTIERARVQWALRRSHMTIERSHYDTVIGFGAIITFLGALQIFFLYDRKNKAMD